MTRLLRPRPFMQVDVFTAVPCLGNPLAVVLDGSGLSDDAMQRFAHWTNLSETTFVLPPTPEGRAAGADYRVRIFTPGAELPFAGHPTLGTFHAWLAHGGQPLEAGVVRQECGVGLVALRDVGGRTAFAAPPLARSTPDGEHLARVLAALGLAPRQVRATQRLNNGPEWLGLLIDHPDTLWALTPDHAALKALGQKVGVAAQPTDPLLIGRSNREARAFQAGAAMAAAGTVAAPAPGTEAEPDLWVRAFAAPVGVDEDPVTGSLNASLAQWLMAEGHLPDHYTAAQGQALGRDGRVYLSRDASDQVWVGGDVTLCIRGEVTL
ncbi:MAG: PhzF family phenazine biosynthesis protein [Burkholderiaceae bacterium]|nr:PhzF family phenazine biosynthesis protein [Burkholderiaceae bacterium]